jgi:hypothetical protein
LPANSITSGKKRVTLPEACNPGKENLIWLLSYYLLSGRLLPANPLHLLKRFTTDEKVLFPGHLHMDGYLLLRTIVASPAAKACSRYRGGPNALGLPLPLF